MKVSWDYEIPNICILYIYGKTNVPNHQPDYEEMEATGRELDMIRLTAKCDLK
jgi:hypothetical protein